jgi:hypothetical protein
VRERERERKKERERGPRNQSKTLGRLRREEKQQEFRHPKEGDVGPVRRTRVLPILEHLAPSLFVKVTV